MNQRRSKVKHDFSNEQSRRWFKYFFATGNMINALMFNLKGVKKLLPKLLLESCRFSAQKLLERRIRIHTWASPSRGPGVIG